VNLLKIIGDTLEKVTKTYSPIRVKFTLPETLCGRSKEYSLIRIHEGKTKVFHNLDGDDNTVTIETDKFSTYVLVYRKKDSVFVTAPNPSILPEHAPTFIVPETSKPINNGTTESIVP